MRFIRGLPSFIRVDAVMLPMIGFPSVVEEHAGFFRRMFSWHQFRRFKQNLGLGSCQLRSLKGTKKHWLLGSTAYSLLKLRICRSRLYRRLQSDRTVGAECRQAFKDLLQNLIQYVYKMADKLPVNKILDVILK